MGHAEVAQAPGQAAQDVLPGGEHVEVALGQRSNAGSCGGGAGHQEGGEDGGDHHGAQHEQTLEEVGPGSGLEAAQKHVADGDGSGHVHGQGLIDAGNGVEQGAASLDGRRRVDGVRDQEHHGADDLQGLGAAQEAVGQVLGNGDGVVGHDGELAQAGSLEDPADGVAQRQADGNPDLTQAQGKDGGRQAHQDPSGHVRRASGKCGYPRSHRAAAQEVLLVATGLGLHEEEDTDAQHAGQIHDEDDELNSRTIHFSSPHNRKSPSSRDLDLNR